MSDQAKIAKKVMEKIRNNKKFLVAAHINLEGDALGSVLGTYQLLKKLNKQVTVYNHDATPTIYKFLPSSEVIKNELRKQRFDIALILDCSDSSRAGKVKDYLGNVDYLINIDHHISNTYFADLNWVDPKASSACEMIYRLCKKFGIMNKEIATCLYTGIFTDTGGFTYTNASSEVHRIAYHLLQYNIVAQDIYTKIHSCCLMKDLRFIARVLSSVKVDPRSRLCWALIERWPKRSDFDITEVIFSIMRLSKEADVFALFKRISKNEVRVNLRSRSKVDVNRVAKFFGGGGHKSASGTTMRVDLKRAESLVISFIRRYTNGRSKRKVSTGD